MKNKEKLFSKIYNNYIDKIYRFVFLKVNSREIAQDLTSEAFLRIWQSLKSGNKIENAPAFLYKIARNLVIDHYRQKAKVQFVQIENIPIADSRTNLEKGAMLGSDIEAVRQAIGSLKEDYQNVVIWHYLDDLSIKEVAKIMGRTEDATRVLLHRALTSLRKEIKSV